MEIRRVVTGHTSGGKAIIASDSRIEGLRSPLFPGHELVRIWGADEPPTYPDGGGTLRGEAFFPPLGGFRFIHYTVPPDSAEAPPAFDVEAAVADLEARAPGLLATMEPDNPGKHRSDTVDFLCVISGRVVLELDDGAETLLNPGDVVIQSGTRHRWRNPGTEPCHMMGALVGAAAARR